MSDNIDPSELPEDMPDFLKNLLSGGLSDLPHGIHIRSLNHNHTPNAEERKKMLTRSRNEATISGNPRPKFLKKEAFAIGTRVVIRKQYETKYTCPKPDRYGIVVHTFKSPRWTYIEASEAIEAFDCIIAVRGKESANSPIFLFALMTNTLRQISIEDLPAIDVELDGYRLPQPKQFKKNDKVHLDLSATDNREIRPTNGNYGIVLEVFREPKFVPMSDNSGSNRCLCDMVVACVTESGKTEAHFFHSSNLKHFTAADAAEFGE